MRIILFMALIAAALPRTLCANDIYRFIPRHSQQVVQINLSDITGLETVKQDLIRNVNRQTGLDQKDDKMLNFGSFIDKIIAVTPDLTVDETCIFVQFKISEAEFCRKLEELAGVKLILVPGTRPAERRFVLQGNQLFPGIVLEKRTFALAFLTGNVAVIAKNDLSFYRKFKELGLDERKRKELTVPHALAAGYTEISAQLLAENPFLPRILRAVYSLAAGKDESLYIRVSATCADEELANQTLMQVQQYVMIGGIVLNQLDPELMQEWMTSVKVNRDKTAVNLNAYFSKRFITRLAEGSEKMTGSLNPADSAVFPDGGKR